MAAPHFFVSFVSSVLKRLCVESSPKRRAEVLVLWPANSSPSMPRNIVVCCDGTANEFARDNTNVVKLYSALVQDPATQATFYHPGLGTREAAGALTSFARQTTKLLGMAVGYGLEDDIRDAYVF